jgi:hypothetical protein
METLPTGHKAEGTGGGQCNFSLEAELHGCLQDLTLSSTSHPQPRGGCLGYRSCQVSSPWAQKLGPNASSVTPVGQAPGEAGHALFSLGPHEAQFWALVVNGLEA